LKLFLVELLLLSPLALYIASYFVVVRPQGGYFNNQGVIKEPWPGLPAGSSFNTFCHYRWGGERAAWFFYPLEQIDRTIRPAAWPLPTSSSDPNFYLNYERRY